MLETHFGKKNTKASYKTLVNYVRYADDFIITGISKELLEDEFKLLVEAFMAEWGLQLSPEKTVITHISGRFDFLRQNVRKYHDKMLIKPAAKGLRNYLQKVRQIVKRNAASKQGDLIRQLIRYYGVWQIIIVILLPKRRLVISTIASGSCSGAGRAVGTVIATNTG
nr:reverse transcriptase domain-containing protein [Snodgrassella alvi]